MSIRERDAAVPERGDTVEVLALVAASRTGDQDAFGRLVAMNERVMLRTALAAVGRYEDAQDVAQEALVAAWTKLGTFRGDSTFRTWLLTIVWRRAVKRRRAVRLWWTRFRSDAHELTFTPSAGLSPEAEAMSQARRRQIAAAIQGLSPKLRDALLLAANGEHTSE